MTGNALERGRSENAADGPSRELARYVKQADASSFSLAEAMKLVPPGRGAIVRHTMEEYRAKLMPLKSLEHKLDGSLSASIRDRFAPIGAKMRPDMSQEQAGFWTAALILAWSDLPPFIVEAALAEAIHQPFEFPTQMEKWVRETADRKLEEHKRAIFRLQQMIEEIQRAAQPSQPLIEDQPSEPMSLEEIRATPSWLRSLGVSSGSIRPEDLALVQAEEASG